MKVLNHHIYEYKKGLRNLVLHTMPSIHRKEVENRLQSNQISYIIQDVTKEKINIFFGADECIAVIEQFGDIKLYDYTPEQDFILGIMLGYSRLQQCNRYLIRSATLKNKLVVV